jgi:hypothetical protein
MAGDDFDRSIITSKGQSYFLFRGSKLNKHFYLIENQGRIFSTLGFDMI